MDRRGPGKPQFHNSTGNVNRAHMRKGQDSMDRTSSRSSEARGDNAFNMEAQRGRIGGGEGRGGGRGRGGRGPRDKDRPMTYGRLKTWAETEDAGQLVLFMASERRQIETFLKEQRIKEDWITLLVKALNFAITAQHQRESIIQLLETLYKTAFFETHLPIYIVDKRLPWPEAETFFKSIISILKEILDKTPKHASKCLMSSTFLLSNLNEFGLSQNLELNESFNAIINRSKECHQIDSNKRHVSSNFSRADANEKPPDNYLNLDVVPNVSDLKADARPFIRCAVTEGVYEDVHNYLDIQFRLMRQDFISPLQKGVNEFRSSGCKKNFNCSDLRLYFDVHIIGTVFKDGIDHILQFDVSKFGNIRWESTKRLIFGSLLCLSKDNFETVIFATVAHRDAVELKKGNISVNVRSGLELIFNSTSNDTFIMAETTAYFESYCHVLEGLKEMVTHLPLQDYLISCKKEIKPPKYLLPSGGIQQIASYNLSCLLKNGDSRQYPVLTTARWPPAEEMCLNSSQREAAIMALTKELAIIQGPPGTGKTYVGLKVMQVLLENQSSLPGIGEDKYDPILVVCYTNHALEQFLEGILEFCSDGIVRVGGKNKSEKLTKFNIRNLRQEFRRDRKFVDLSVRNSKFECLSELKSVAEEIEKLNKSMESLDTEIQTEDVLENVMLDHHYDAFRSSGPNPSLHRQQMRQWLNASSDSPEVAVPKMIKQHMTKLILQLGIKPWDGKINSKMGVLQRANIYLNWLVMYRDYLHRQMQVSSSYHYQVKSALDETNKKIISENQMEVIVPRTLLTEISLYFKQGKSAAHSGTLIETWLLGTFRGLNEQLDDVQILMDVLSGKNDDSDVFDDFEAVKQVEDDRVDDDDDDEDEENYSKKIKMAKNNLTSIMKRAELLGIQDDVLEAEERDDGWRVQTYVKPLSFGKIRKKIATTKAMTEEEVINVSDVWKLDLNKKFALYNFWIKKYKEDLTDQMTNLVERYKSAHTRKEEAGREETLAILKRAKVIGMTTTGAAKHRAVLQALGCRIIVVEEAAEVLESHIITALNKNCNHLILIGDHQQLRPNPTVYELAIHYGLEISLFERLIKNHVPHVLLKEQHRMRPEVSKIMRHIYKDLEDHESVTRYENIRGVSKNIFFINHNEKESKVEDTRSKANEHEAQYLVALCNYLMMQGYQDNQITILATYTGQVFSIKKILRGDQKNTEPDKKSCRVRITAVDNFQGEENDIILLSLVRSNDDSNVGFLKIDNRVCVALSRAKKGLYVIGNFDILYKSSKLWKNIVDSARSSGMIDDSLEVVCPNHVDFKQYMKEPEDFQKCPEGGCGKPCTFRLPCGHVCARLCHGNDQQHMDYICRKPCPKSCKEGHLCRRKCYQDCGDCFHPVLKKMILCGHNDMIPCHLSPLKAVCSQRCEAILDCEHQCSGACGQCKKNKQHEKCKTEVPHCWPCGHICKLACHLKSSSDECQKICDSLLECGHRCKGKCSECLEGIVHISCKEPCDKLLLCGHKCESTCGVPCSPCTEVCPQQCIHAACNTLGLVKSCSHRCIPCIEKCSFKCQHGKCSNLCSEPCNVEPCTEKCIRKVHICSDACGGRKKCRFNLQNCTHICSGLCGEICVCSVCEKVITITPAAVQTQSATANTDRLIKLPSCHHIFKVSELDNYVNNFDPNGTSYIPCPACYKPIMKCWRYESINKKRGKKMADLKAKSENSSTISKNDEFKLIQSQRLITDPQMSSFLYVDIKVSNIAEKMAVSSQFKFAYVLSAVSSLAKAGSDLSKQINARKMAIMSIGKKISAQCRKEMTLELTRCLQLAYLEELQDVCSLHSVVILSHLEKLVKDCKMQLKSIRPDTNTLEHSKAVILTLRRTVKEMTTLLVVQAKCQLMEETFDKAVRVLNSQDDEMLCDVIHNDVLPIRSSLSASTVNSLSSSFATSAQISSSVTERITETLHSIRRQEILKARMLGKKVADLSQIPKSVSSACNASYNPFDGYLPRQKVGLIDLDSDTSSSDLD